ncbi:hypothetical protein L1987_44610 [Smallanthus sonchifolius]|uniref:Uncharacterized protein n=1 Tax=Smallanthus sonchifolius TaxID=185202 RepID=A0ACB9GR01_9ASTR|nr:hypothetical protein L1987_44610 [Smallanthus sonchifolius]
MGSWRTAMWGWRTVMRIPCSILITKNLACYLKTRSSTTMRVWHTAMPGPDQEPLSPEILATFQQCFATPIRSYLALVQFGFGAVKNHKTIIISSCICCDIIASHLARSFLAK